MIVFYDENLKMISFPIRDFYSLEWTEAWTEPSEWSLNLPKEYMELAMKSAYIYAEGIGFGIVESIKTDTDSLQTGGRGLEAFLDHFVVTQERTLTGKAEEAARGLVAQYARGVSLEEVRGYKNALAQIISPGSLMDAVYQILNPRGMSFCLEIENGRIIFRTKKGENRTSGQTARPWVQFSTGLKNLTEPNFERNTRDEKSIVILRNSIEEDDVTTVTLYTYDFR